ncbi:MAG TPA: folylpolyglutamate synthase/dihydrofolate synthase family protein [Anaerolineaceae bacterium]|nr:folylpolyglutamate synthase/dihydrofolate synthase family protein [Anaerolineaceae bacterium]HPN53673.1 folylpolyglutamate synthase/dihydrofolate synthase family protein [Anaerolineaceae bacterium]
MEQLYQEALDYLYGFVDYSMTRALRFSAEKFNLDRMSALLTLLDHPERTYRVIHVAGTKGKGSVSALCASAIQAAGYKTGLYTSPHLHDYNERIQVNGEPIPHLELARLVAEIKPFVVQVPELTTFEITTALGFWYFARQGVDVAVIEVGLGGRLDATNVVDPLVSVITSLSYDHMAVLGNTLAEIAGEKAGIIKVGRPAVSSPQKAEAQAVLEAVSAARQASLTLVGRDVQYERLDQNLNGQRMSIWQGQRPLLQVSLPLLGQHQTENAATACAALWAAREAGLVISDAAIQTGFAQVSWPGRFEVLRSDPPVVVDCAHNRDSAVRLREAMHDLLPNWPVVLVLGFSEDKDIDGMLAELLPLTQEVVAARADHPRALEAGQLADMVRAARPDITTEACGGVQQAMQRAKELAGTQKAILVTGSIFVTAEARQAWPNLD